MSLVYLWPCKPSSLYHLWNDLLTHACLKYVGNIFLCCQIISTYVECHLRQASAFYLDRWNWLFQNLHIKTAVCKALLNGCKEKPTSILYIKPLQAFHAWCLQGILEIRCKSMLEKGTNWTASHIVAKPCHVDTGTRKSHMASNAIATTLYMTRKKCYNKDHAKVSMAKWGI